MFVPWFNKIATPIVIINNIGSNHEVVVSAKTIKHIGIINSIILLTSFDVASVAVAVLTAVPAIALSSPIKSLISFTASILLFSLIVTLNNAEPSL